MFASERSFARSRWENDQSRDGAAWMRALHWLSQWRRQISSPTNYNHFALFRFAFGIPFHIDVWIYSSLPLAITFFLVSLRFRPIEKTAQNSLCQPINNNYGVFMYDKMVCTYSPLHLPSPVVFGHSFSCGIF